MSKWIDIPDAVAALLEGQRRLIRKLDRLETTLANLETNMASAMERIRATVEADRSVTESAVKLLNELSVRLREAVSTQDIQQIEAFATELENNTKKLADAVAANTPTLPAAPTEPEPDADADLAEAIEPKPQAGG